MSGEKKRDFFSPAFYCSGRILRNILQTGFGICSIIFHILNDIRARRMAVYEKDDKELDIFDSMYSGGRDFVLYLSACG